MRELQNRFCMVSSEYPVVFKNHRAGYNRPARKSPPAVNHSRPDLRRGQCGPHRPAPETGQDGGADRQTTRGALASGTARRGSVPLCRQDRRWPGTGRPSDCAVRADGKRIGVTCDDRLFGQPDHVPEALFGHMAHVDEHPERLRPLKKVPALSVSPSSEPHGAARLFGRFHTSEIIRTPDSYACSRSPSSSRTASAPSMARNAAHLPLCMAASASLAVRQSVILSAFSHSCA